MQDEIAAESTNLSGFQQQRQFLQMEKESLIQELARATTKNQLLDGIKSLVSLPLFACSLCL